MNTLIDFPMVCKRENWENIEEIEENTSATSANRSVRHCFHHDHSANTSEKLDLKDTMDIDRQSKGKDGTNCMLEKSDLK